MISILPSIWMISYYVSVAIFDQTITSDEIHYQKKNISQKHLSKHIFQISPKFKSLLTKMKENFLKKKYQQNILSEKNRISNEKIPFLNLAIS